MLHKMTLEGVDSLPSPPREPLRLCNKMSAIHCNEAVEGATDEMARLEIDVEASAASTDIRPNEAVMKTTTEAEKENGAVATTSADMVVINKEEKKDLESGSIAALFAAQGMKSLKQEVISEKNCAIAKEEVVTNEEEKNNLDQIHHCSIAALFAAQGAKFRKQANQPEESPFRRDNAEKEDVVARNRVQEQAEIKNFPPGSLQ